jgi:hypothetical protein
MHDLAAVTVEMAKPFGVIAEEGEQISFAAHHLRADPDKNAIAINLIALDAES